MVLTVLVLVFLALWGLLVTGMGATSISLELQYPEIFPSTTTRIVSQGIKAVLIGALWVPIAVVLLVKMLRSRTQEERFRKLVRHSWGACGVYVALVLIILK